jgi:hypothetical protein
MMTVVHTIHIPITRYFRILEQMIKVTRGSVAVNTTLYRSLRIFEVETQMHHWPKQANTH